MVEHSRWGRRTAIATVAGPAAALVLLFGAPAAAAASTLYVNSATGTDSTSCGASTSPCRTIQQAVDNASNGDTIEVAAGVYPGPVTVDKSLGLVGAQAGHPGSAARAAAPASESVVTAGNIDVEASNVEVDGFSFDQPGNQVCVACQAFESQTAVTITDNVFTGYQPDSFGPWQVSGPVGVNHTTDTTITANYFSSPGADLGDFGGATVQWFDGGCSGADVSGNVFDNADASALAAVYFYCDDDAVSAITVSGNSDTIVGGSSFVNFQHIGGSGGEIDVTGNTITMTPAGGSGMYFGNYESGVGRLEIRGNSLTGDPFRAVKLSTNAELSGTVDIAGNDFSHDGVGVYVGRNSLSAGANLTIEHDDLSNETGDSAGDAADGVDDNPGSGGSADAVDNWWGCNAGPNQPGCSMAVGDVTYDPWLVLGISASPSTLPAGSSSTITADVTHDSAGNDTSASGTIPDGTTIVFTTDFGLLSAPAAGTVGGKASVTLTSPAPGTANVSATLDSQTVSTTVTFTPNLPTSAAQCKNGGWQSFGKFKNQGDCVSYVATGGRNRPNG
jgi:hypothetical protein